MYLEHEKNSGNCDASNSSFKVNSCLCCECHFAFMQDSVVLGRMLGNAIANYSSTEEIGMVLRAYEKERIKRCLPLTIKANLFGYLLTLPSAAVSYIRDTFISSSFFSPMQILRHSLYNCGTLSAAAS